MLLKIQSYDDKILEKIYNESLDALNAFYEIDWVHHLPALVIVKDRETADILKGEKSESWQVGWAENSKIYVLDRVLLEKEGNPHHKIEQYSSLIKHEMSHAFSNILSSGHTRPSWLWEGVAIYTSGQNMQKTKPVKFEKFLEYYDKWDMNMYSESGFAVEILVKKFGKQKLLDLIKELKLVNSRSDFEHLFEKNYSIQPKYEEFNKLYIETIS